MRPRKSSARARRARGDRARARLAIAGRRSASGSPLRSQLLDRGHPSSSSSAPARSPSGGWVPPSPVRSHLDERRRVAVPQGLPRICQDQGQGRLDPVDRRDHRLAPTRWPAARTRPTSPNSATPRRRPRPPSGMLANITSDVNSWSNKSDLVPGMLANDTQNGQRLRRAVVRRRAGHLVPHRPVQGGRDHLHRPPPGPQLVSDAKALQKKYPGTLRPGRAEQLHQRHRQLHLGRRRPGRRAEERQVDRPS